MTQLPSFEVDTSEAITFETVEPGTYTMMLKGPPKLRLSQRDQTPYLAWQFVHTTGKGGASVWENTMLRGKGAGRLISFFAALGYDEAAVKTLKVRPMGDISSNAKEGVPAELTINGTAFQPEGKTIDVVLRINDDGTHTPRNEVSRFLAKRA